MTDIIIQGIYGRMGRALLEKIGARDDCRVVAGVDRDAGNVGGIPVYAGFAELPCKGVIIDFSSPAGAVAAAQYGAENGLPCVICSTGLSKEDEAVLEAAGVQILTQDLWETLVSFVISQNNNIPRIKKLVAALCKQFGERRQLAGHEFYTFPTWERLAGQDLSSLGLGYRDKYVEQLAQNVTDGRIDLHELTGMETEQARTYLKSIHGVGNKVADCVLLFGLHRVEAFPVDTWIRQVIDEHYGGKFPVEHYDGHAGIIQQFIFYYMQQHKGGKTT